MTQEALTQMKAEDYPFAKELIIDTEGQPKAEDRAKKVLRLIRLTYLSLLPINCLMTPDRANHIEQMFA
jgi:hypothetical protein